MNGWSSVGTWEAALSIALSRGCASFTGSTSGGAITGGLGAEAPSAGTLGGPPAGAASAVAAGAAGAAAGAAGAAGVCSTQGVLPVVAIASPESVTWTVYENDPASVG